MSKLSTPCLKTGTLLFIVITFCSSLFSQETSALFATYDQKFTMTMIEDQLALLVKKLPTKYTNEDEFYHPTSYYQLTENSFKLFSSPEKSPPEEYTILLASNPPFPEEQAVKKKRTSLENLTIAIDPGHLGGDYCVTEQKYINMNFPNRKNKCIHFNEGDLTLFTARVLKKMLEKKGANVFLTRETSGKKAGPLDYKTRAELINKQHPDITLMIHYNASQNPNDEGMIEEPFKNDYNIVYVPGAFMTEEFKTPEDRYEFMRLLLSDDIYESTQLCHFILEHLTKRLHLPPREKNDQHNTIAIEAGLEARNLAMTRLVHGTLCYGETLFQDNFKEAKKLDKENVRFEELEGPRRAVQVAHAYYHGILDYFEVRD